MIPIHEYAGRDVAVFGLGRTGISAAKALMAGGARVHAWDDGEETRKKAAAQGIPLSDLNKMDWQQLAVIVLSPGVPLRFPQPHRVVKMAEMVGVPIVGDVELFARAVQALPERARPKVVGITGTNGKSTTTALIAHILKQAGRDVRMGGNIGTGVLDLAPLNALSVYVLELSSYQLDLVKSLHCDVAIWLNISPDHLDRHGGMAGYMAAKKRIFLNQTPGDTAVLGVDSRSMQAIALELKNRDDGPGVVPVSAAHALGRGVSVLDGRVFEAGVSGSMRIGDVRPVASLPGRHNNQNIAAAFAACRALGLEAGVIMDSIATFPGLAHRLETVATVQGVRFVNDSKATNADSAEQALKAFPKVRWIVGGKAKSDGIDALEPLFGRVERAYLIGEAEDRFAATLSGKVDFMRCGTMANAVRDAFRDALASGEKEPIVLLSPACASFDQYKDFEARGDDFRRLVELLAQPVEQSRAEGGT